MLINSKNIEVICGNLPTHRLAMTFFSDAAVDFLSDLSIAIRNDKNLNSFTDLKTFGFWCRSNNLIKVKSGYLKKNKSIGRGIALHITPSNVAMTFAYSLAFGLLSGNINIVRLPSRDFHQVEAFVNIINSLLSKQKHRKIRPFICLIKYDRSDSISNDLSTLADTRLIWGGDETIAKFKKFSTKPKCLDLVFPDRYSIALINPVEISTLSDHDLSKITERFFNDTYFMDQRGCSSPQSVIWTSTKYNDEKDRFWASLTNIVRTKYDHNISVAADKYGIITDTAVHAEIDFKLIESDFRVTRLQISEFQNLETIQCNFGMFAEAAISNLSELNYFITERYQTLTFLGLDKADIENALFKDNQPGIDRIVPIGRAFDMTHVWDGYDIISMLSKTIGD